MERLLDSQERLLTSGSFLPHLFVIIGEDRSIVWLWITESSTMGRKQRKNLLFIVFFKQNTKYTIGHTKIWVCNIYREEKMKREENALLCLVGFRQSWPAGPFPLYFSKQNIGFGKCFMNEFGIGLIVAIFKYIVQISPITLRGKCILCCQISPITKRLLHSNFSSFFVTFRYYLKLSFFLIRYG